MFSVPEQTSGKHSDPSASTGDWLRDSYRQQNSQHSSRSRETPQYTQPATSMVGHPRIQPAMVCVVLQYVFVGKINLRYRWILAVQTHVVQGSTVH